MHTNDQIQGFLSKENSFALAGVSRNEQKFSTQVFMKLKESGFQVLPVNPNVDELLGEKSFRSVNDLPQTVSHLFIVTPKPETDKVLQEAIDKGIKNVWIQQMSQTEQSEKLAQENDINLINGECIFMFTEPVKGIHKFHRAIKKFFGALPK